MQQQDANDTASTAASADQSGDQEAQHYDAVAATYESAFFYSSIEYRDWVMGHLLHHFRLPNEVRLCTTRPAASGLRRCSLRRASLS